eukprot:Pgem_evm1s1239
MPEVSQTHLGGTMRLGLKPTIFTRDCLTKKLYGGHDQVHERHRHRYEVCPDKIATLEENGMHFVGHHPFYVGVQYHPEYLTQPLKPSPIFI